MLHLGKLVSWLIFGYLVVATFQAIPQVAKVGTTSYRDAVFGFIYTYPAYLQSQAPARPLLDSIGKQADDSYEKRTASCIEIPLRTKGTRPEFYERMLVAETNFDCLQKVIPDNYVASFTETMFRSLMQTYGPLQQNAVQTFSFDGHLGAYTSGIAQADSVKPGMKLYAAESCVLLQHTFVCWNLESSSVDQLKMLEQTQVAFEGDTAVPVIPQASSRP